MSFRVYQECRAATGWQLVEVPSTSPDLNDPYKVLVPPWDAENEEYICECEGYKFRGRCRHQLEAAKTACYWTELNSPLTPQTEEQKENHVCPSCGGQTRTVIEDMS